MNHQYYVSSALGYVVALAVLSSALITAGDIGWADKLAFTLIGGYAGSTLLFYTDRYNLRVCQILQDITGFGAAAAVLIQVWGV